MYLDVYASDLRAKLTQKLTCYDLRGIETLFSHRFINLKSTFYVEFLTKQNPKDTFSIKYKIVLAHE